MSRLILLGLLLLPRAAEAHGTSKSFAEWTFHPRSARVRTNFAGHDLALAVPGLDRDGDGSTFIAEFEAMKDEIGRRTVEHAALWAAEAKAAPKERCTPSGAPVVQALGNPIVTEVRVTAELSCPTRIGFVSVESRQLPELEPPHITVATFLAGPTTAQHVFTAAQPRFEMEMELPSLAEELGASAFAGVRASMAPAALLFLLGLLLLEPTKPSAILLAIYVAGLLGGGLVDLRGLWVRLVVALSVAFVGAALVARKEERLPIWKPIGAAPLAFVHGSTLAVAGGLANRIAGTLAEITLALVIFVASVVLTIVLKERAARYRRPVGIAWLCGAGALTALVFV